MTLGCEVRHHLSGTERGATGVSGTVTFEEAPPPGTINLGIGQPSADLLPVELIRQASESFFEGAQPIELNYGVLQGDERFLDSLAGFLTAGYG